MCPDKSALCEVMHGSKITANQKSCSFQSS